MNITHLQYHSLILDPVQQMSRINVDIFIDHTFSECYSNMHRLQFILQHHLTLLIN